MRTSHLAGFLVLAAAGLAGCGGPQRLALGPTPAQDDDRYDIPQPKVRVRDDYYDLLDYTVFKQIEQVADLPRDLRKVAGKPMQALNATPLDEVQDSSWFTNRIGVRDVTAEEIARGPNRATGPDLEHPWTVVAGKYQGVTPGFRIKDGRGDTYFVKFDPPQYPEISTAADVIGAKLFWAMGYNVPENYLAFVRRENLQIGKDAKVKTPLNSDRPMTPADLDLLLSKAARRPDGSIRVVASRRLAGKTLGPFAMLGLRKDDPNDVIRHEHRRELRGYKVFSAWTNHNDSREINTLDAFVEENGRHFVRHSLIDFSAIMGSRYGPNLRYEGYEYVFDAGEMALAFLTAGLHEPRWTTHTYPEILGVGRFDSQHFNPIEWKPDYPNPAFENTTARDAFWAARIVMRFDDRLLRAAVETGQFSDPAATDSIVKILAERRDRVGRFWFSRLNPLDAFEVTPGGPALRFEDLAVKYKFVPPRRYDVLVQGPKGRLASFVTQATEVPLAEVVRALGAPAPDDVRGRLLRLSIRSSLPDLPTWTPKVDVTLYLQPSAELRVAKISRDE